MCDAPRTALTVFVQCDACVWDAHGTTLTVLLQCEDRGSDVSRTTLTVLLRSEARVSDAPLAPPSSYCTMRCSPRSDSVTCCYGTCDCNRFSCLF